MFTKISGNPWLLTCVLKKSYNTLKTECKFIFADVLVDHFIYSSILIKMNIEYKRSKNTDKYNESNQRLIYT